MTFRTLSVLAAPLALAALAPAALAAPNLMLSVDDNLADGVEREYATAGSQITYTVGLKNSGDVAANGASLVVTLPPSIAQATWTAAYTGGAEGPVVGTAGPTTMVDMPAGSRVVFTIVATVAPDAVGELVVTAMAAQGAQTVTATDTDQLLPASLAVSDQAGWGRTSRARLVAPTGSVVGTLPAFAPGFRGGVQTAPADLDADGRVELVVVPGPGAPAEVRVLPVPLSRASSQTGHARPTGRPAPLRPFGAGYRGGLSVAAGDFNGDGRDDIAVAQSSGSRVRVFVSRPGPPGTFRPLRSFTPRVASGARGISLAAGDFGTFRRGVRNPAVPDGRAELLVASGPGAPARVDVRDVSRDGVPVLDTIRPFGGAPVGVNVAVGRVSRDSIPDLVMTPGSGGPSRVAVHDGRVGPRDNRRIAVVRARARTALAGPAFAAPVDTTGDGRANLIRVVHPARTGARASTFALADRGQGGLAVSRASEAAAPAYGRLTTAPAPTSGIVTTASGLQYRDVVVGTGASPSGADATVQVTYRGWLLDGTPIDAGQGQSFPLNGVIAGWAEGIAAMRVGGRRQLIIPADLAYGAKGTGSVPPGSTLVFDVELLSTT
jgi:uncharacterized repeat protein (TIGR01451 family)